MPRRLPTLGSLALLAILVIVLVSGRDEEGGQRGGSAEPHDGAPRNGIVVPVVDVVDGDTIEVLVDGVEEDVRYIGVDTPEVDPSIGVECFGSQASEANRRLVAGERVRLVFDDERRDRYGRLLAYVYVGERFVNEELVRGGYATTLTIAPNTDFAGRFDRLEQSAGNAGRGLWGECGA
jgi:micrococcal nuclease